MGISVRKRGEIYHARGTVRVGQKAVRVAEFSTGSRGRADAEAVAAAREAEIRRDILEGPAGRAKRVTVADCIASYLQRPGGVEGYDVRRAQEFNRMFGDKPLDEAGEGWQMWLRERGSSQLPSTVARWRSTLQAALNHGAAAYETLAPKLPGVRQSKEERVRYLVASERDRLLAAYGQHARPVAITLAWQGFRTQEALRMDWRDVSWRRRTIFIPTSKTGRARTVPMHRNVRVTLYLLWRKAGRPESGTVFLNRLGQPYTDTRGVGGSPLKTQHANACKKAGIQAFRVHDWRHSWAANMVMTGTDLYTVMRLGGWKKLGTVQRYAAVSTEHMAEAMARLR